MEISKIMSLEVQCISPDATLLDAARILRDRDIGSLPVCEDDRLVGIVTDRDITVRGIADECPPDRTSVRDIMTAGIIYVYADQDVAAAASLMEEKQIRRLPVLSRQQRVVGIVALGDIALDDQVADLGGRALHGISAPGNGQPPSNGRVHPCMRR